MTKALEVLRSVYGYESFRSLQGEVVETAISGRDVVFIAATGEGKSVCFQIPALVREGVGVVIAPLRALIKDQVDELNFQGVRAETINSEITGYDRLNVMNAVREGDVDFLYITPELFAQPSFLKFLKSIKVSCFGIDEAHCASQMGKDFRPDYQSLGMIAHHFPGVPRVAVTASADPATLSDIVATLDMRSAKVLQAGIDRKNIFMSIRKRGSKKEQQDTILSFLKEREGESTIIYCTGRNTVEKVADWLNEEGVQSLGYHAHMSDSTRQRNQEAFMNGEVGVLVSTVAFGMGVNKSDIRNVIHFDMPSNIESYQQETGRAGRDGLPSTAMMFFGNMDVVVRKKMIKKSNGNAATKRTNHNKFDTLVGMVESPLCRRRAILTYFGQSFIGSCGNCDNCTDAPKSADATAEAKAVLLHVSKGEGADDLHSLMTRFSMNADFPDHSDEYWTTLIRQMAANALLEVRHTDYGRVYAGSMAQSLDEDGFSISAEPLLTSAKFTKGAKTRALTTNKKTSKPRETRTESIEPVRRRKKGSPLLEALRRMRNQIAKEERKVRHYVVHDSSLQQMAAELPMTAPDLLSIKGIGEAKLAAYGHRFISVIRLYAS